MIDLKRLGKLRLFVVDAKGGRPVAGVPVSVFLPIPRPSNDGDEDDNVSSNVTEPGLVPLGRLVCDHAGYVSFNIAKAAASIFPPGQPLHVPTLFAEVEGDRESRIDVARAFGAPPDRSDMTRSHAQPDPLWPIPNCVPLVLCTKVQPSTLSVERNQKNCACGDALAGPSVQDPDACDYALSPSSFMVPIRLRSGEGDCERLVPATLPLNSFVFFQVVARSAPSSPQDRGPLFPHLEVAAPRTLEVVTEPVEQPLDVTGMVEPASGLRWGELLEYEQTWHALGHSLGEIKYSLGLAPGESTQVAVIDWSRVDDILRVGQVESAEVLRHRQGRDRQIEEVVTAALAENQGGGSFQAGLGAAASISAQPVSGAATLGIGGAVTHSWGNRDLSANTIQDVNDRVQQASSLLRSQTSTVIIQAGQKEANQLSVRAVANHNHCHALTIQYYEVLRHLLVSTSFKKRSWAILVPFKPISFNQALALRFREALAPALLRNDLLPAFDAMERLASGDAAYAPPPAPPIATAPAPSRHKVTSFELTLFSDRQVNGGTTWGRILVRLYMKGEDNPIVIWEKLNVGQGGPELKNVGWPARNLEGKEIDPTEIEKVEIGWYEDNDYDHWGFAGIRLECRVEGEQASHLLINNSVATGHIYRFDDSNGQWKYAGPYVVTPYRLQEHEDDRDRTDGKGGGLPADADRPRPDKNTDSVAEKGLIDHLNANRTYYSRAVWFGMDAGERRMLLEVALGNLIQGLDDRPIGWSGNHVAFRFDGPLPGWLEKLPAPVPELGRTIVTLPTRGLFVEAQLGHCTACEKRDVTRMWNWAELPVEALPQLQGLTPGPRGQTPDVKPDTLGANVLNVLQAPQVPDPVGLAAAIAAVSRGDAFRDMSGLQQVSDLLGKLASGAVDLTKGEQQLRAQAATAKEKVDRALSNGSGGGGRQQSPAELYDQLQVAKHFADAARERGLSEEEAKELFKDVGTGGGAPGVFGLVKKAVADMALGALPADSEDELAHLLPDQRWEKPPQSAVDTGMLLSDRVDPIEITRFEGGAARLEEYEQYPSYQILGDQKEMAWIRLKSLGGAQGVDGFIELEWMPGQLHAHLAKELIEDRDTDWRTLGNVDQTIAQIGIKATLKGVKVGTVVKEGEIKVWLQEGEKPPLVKLPKRSYYRPRAEFEIQPAVQVRVRLVITTSTGDKTLEGKNQIVLSAEGHSRKLPRFVDASFDRTGRLRFSYVTSFRPPE